ncbi:carboxypeptidase-like regulatory domain-containing protein [Marinoscillum sp. MHG1-6]|uniref:carboxypeptidase-like regulatory domain-containing protein n=1 Tax=Marinoscillum sp. MHG1-6 TaxID=2959627 RepID=UPI0021573902|nr:carboxypeptidase-like regulatory domain-containing protein [Marinoscillum sp. MHG1-6]
MIRYLLTIATLVAIGYTARAQYSIAGRVLNEQGDEIGFTHVFNKSSGLGKVADINGKFNLLANKGDTIQFSFVGYKNHEVIITPIHLANYMQVVLPEDPVILPSVTIYADPYYKVPLNMQGPPMYLRGISVDEDKPAIQPGQITYGTSPGPGGIPGGGVTLNGPITYFSKGEREKRKAAEIVEEDAKVITYSQFVAEDSIKQRLMKLYALDSTEYDMIIVRLNNQYPGIAKASTPEEVWHWMLRFFNQTVPVVRAFQMH